MGRRDTARLAAMSDPERNRWFRYRWTLLPSLERKCPDAPTPGQDFQSNISAKDSVAAEKAQARAAAEALFSRAGAP
jgi:hypothetical protein